MAQGCSAVRTISFSKKIKILAAGGVRCLDAPDKSMGRFAFLERGSAARLRQE
jgi:hypothetical protein